MGNLKNKRFRYGTFSTAMMLVAIVLFIVVNLFATEFNRSFDLTAEQIFTLTPQTRNFLDNLDTDVTLTFINPTGGANDQLTPIIAQLLEEYAAASRHITIEHRDPMINPAFVHQLSQRAGLEEGMPTGSVVVESGNRIRAVLPMDMIEVGFQQGQPFIRRYNFEPAITRAINHVTQGEPTAVYVVTGSGELGISPSLAAVLESENYSVSHVNLVMNDVPDTAEILFITMPSHDWTPYKAERILNFLDHEGRAFMALGTSPVQIEIGDMPNLDSVLAAYGVALGNYFVVENNPANMVLGNIGFLLPMPTEHEVMNTVLEGEMFNLLRLPVFIDPLQMRRTTTTIEPLLFTSRDALAVVEATDTDLEAIQGPFVLAAAITDVRPIEQIAPTRIVLVSGTDIVNDEAAMIVGPGNVQFVLGALTWLQDQPTNIWVPGRTPPGVTPIMLTQMQANFMFAVALVVFPVGLLAVGVFIWFRRRNA